MILVNSPGSWAHIYPPLRHAAWHGWTPTDLVFPFFLFIVGVAISLSLGRRLDSGTRREALVLKIYRRAAVIFGLGLFLNGFPFNVPLNAEMAAGFEFGDILRTFEAIRIWGVLQRIAMCYLIVALTVVLTRGTRSRLAAGAVILLAYELLMRVPLIADWGAGSFALADNFVRWLDLVVVGENHLYRVRGLAFDPEGLLSTLPAAATTLVGFFVGEYLRGPREHGRKLMILCVSGCAGAVGGWLGSHVEPVNKQLWTVSYVVLTGGLATVGLAVSSWLIDVRRWHRGTRPAVVFGSNPLVVFLGSGLLARLLYLVKVSDQDGGTVSLQIWLYRNVFVPAAGEVNGSLLYAVVNVLFWLLVLWWLYHRRIFVKI